MITITFSERQLVVCMITSLITLLLSSALFAMTVKEPTVPVTMSQRAWEIIAGHSTTVVATSALVMTGLFSARRWGSDRQQYQVLMQELAPLSVKLQTQSQELHVQVAAAAAQIVGAPDVTPSLTQQAQQLVVDTSNLQTAMVSLRAQLTQQSQTIKALLAQVQTTQALAHGLQQALTADQAADREHFAVLERVQSVGLATLSQRVACLKQQTTATYTSLTATAMLMQKQERQEVVLSKKLHSIQQDLANLKQHLATKAPISTGVAPVVPRRVSSAISTSRSHSWMIHNAPRATRQRAQAAKLADCVDAPLLRAALSSA